MLGSATLESAPEAAGTCADGSGDACDAVPELVLQVPEHQQPGKLWADGRVRGEGRQKLVRVHAYATGRAAIASSVQTGVVRSNHRQAHQPSSKSRSDPMDCQ